MKLLMNHKNSLMIHGPISLNNEVLMIINDHEIFIKKSQPGQVIQCQKITLLMSQSDLNSHL